MAVIISSKNSEKEFGSNKIITVGSSELNDFCLDGIKFELILEFDESTNSYLVSNNLNNIPLFKGESFKHLKVSNVARFLFPNSDEFINIKVLPVTKTDSNKSVFYSNSYDIKNFKNHLDEIKSQIEQRRTSIIKQNSHKINDLKKKISQNTKGTIFTHIALFGACYVCAFAVTNYIAGLSIKESTEYIHLPSDLKLWFLYTILILGILLIFKQGMFGYFYAKSYGNQPKMSRTVQIILNIFSLTIISGVYIINLIYYLDYTKNLVFPILISLFFVGIAIALAVSSGYYKSNTSELSELLNKYEYREDFEKVIQDYQTWINYYVNALSDKKIQYISDLKFKLRIKEIFETAIGILTAPFLAFGVSNTLALCFSDAAGWIKISGVRFSPIFLILSSFLIIFAFFLFVHGFFVLKKINNSEVIKHDGFSNYLMHCTDILGIEGTSKEKSEMKFAFYSASAIILIEFSMNISYFFNEIGQDFSGLIVSIMAALIPTALLIAETFILGNTKFKLYALDSITAKADK